MSSTARMQSPATASQGKSSTRNGNKQTTPERYSQSPPKQTIAQTGSQSSPYPAYPAYPAHSFEYPSSTTAATAIFDEHGFQTSPPQFDDQGQYFNTVGNYLTPDEGSDNLLSEQSSYNTPSLDDFIWQETYNTNVNLNDFDQDVTLVNNIYADTDQSEDLQGIVSKELSPPTIKQQSTTPQTSTTRTSTSVQSNMATTSSASYAMSPENHKRSRASDDDGPILQAEDSVFSTADQHQHRQRVARPSIPPLVQPTVLVSTYNRGDSPARTALPLARSLSKRSQGSRLSDRGENTATNDAEATESAAAGSRLMPPDDYVQWTQNDDDDDDDDDNENELERAGVAPTNRNADTVPSLNDMEKQRELDETRAGVENWLESSNAGAAPDGQLQRRLSRNRSRKERIRSRSQGTSADRLGTPRFSDKHVPGPGLLLDVDSDNDYSEDESSYGSSNSYEEGAPESPPAHVEAGDPSTSEGYFAPDSDVPVAPEDDEPLPSQFYRRKLWQDPARFPETSTKADQPPTSNHAIAQYQQQAAQFETASRAATWGTRRRLSDSEIASIVDGSKVRHLSLSHKARDRGSSIINRARTVMRRSSGTIKKKSKEHLNRQYSNPSPPAEPQKNTVLGDDPSHTATSPIQQVQRTFSWGKSKSPPLTATGGALLAMTSHLTAVGGSTKIGAGVESAEVPKSPFLTALKRSRSKSDIPKVHKATPGLSDLFNRHGGPPMPTLASPMPTRNEVVPPPPPPQAEQTADDMDEDNDDEVPIKMELPVQTDNIIPNLDGFRTHAKQLNPRLEPYLVERIAQDQIRRYKKLVKNKVEHTRNVQLQQKCSSGAFCKDLGGKPKILPPRTNVKDTNVNYAQFKVGAGGDSDGEEGVFDGGVVTPALFPSGIPLPPATHLPAEFECPLCFQVKKFSKPSDWTKHVHEDVQPFSCTFPNCPEPKSFKRKADWVRHENERHRHLEWWKCSIQECSHVCYRKDNFVQHLVREHKMTEPKAKNQRPLGNKARPAGRSSQGMGLEADEFWQLVEHCRHDTAQIPRNEPCKFCGNVCSTWKKLSVHVGKHMEQIAMPVLDLAAKRIITVDTIISPVDPPNQSVAQNSMLDTTMLSGTNVYEALSPYSASAVSMYQSSSAGQSPVPTGVVPNQGVPMNMPSGLAPGFNPGFNSNFTPSSGFYESGYESGAPSMGMGSTPTSMRQYGNGNVGSQNFQFPRYEVANGSPYAPLQHQTGSFTQQSVTPNVSATMHSHQLPRSQPMDPNYGNMNVETMSGTMYGGQYYPTSTAEQGFMGGYSTSMGHNDGLHSPLNGQAGHPHSPAATQPNGNNYLYTHNSGNNHNNHNQGAYY